MTPKKKAEELINLYENYFEDYGYECNAQRCATIAVGEIIMNLVLLTHTTANTRTDLGIDYWSEVQEEIKNQ